jgi:hypothetical protein
LGDPIGAVVTTDDGTEEMLSPQHLD